MFVSVDRCICIVWKSCQRFGFTTKQSIISMVPGLMMGTVLPIMAAVSTNKALSNPVCVMIGSGLSIAFSIQYVVFNVIFILRIVLT